MADTQLDNMEARKRIQELFRYTQVGLCVNSVTHDLNNFLGAIMAYSELVGMDAGVSADSQRMLNEVLTAVRRASTLVSHLTDVARKERPDVRIATIQEIIQRVLELRLYEIRLAQIDLHTSYPDIPQAYSIDVPKLQLAFMYLLSNAIEAVHGTTGSMIWITVSEVHDGGCTVIFKDSGPPIPPETAEGMFDAFQTSKGGCHLGLGLPNAREAVRHHGGELAYDPVQGFVVSLPRRSPLVIGAD